MKGLTKVQKPGVLEDNEEEWTEAYVAAVAAGDSRRHVHWNHPQIKSALRDELAGKCAYCEGYVEDVAYPHVEHIIPKSVKPELAHRWANLTSACERCNVEKGDFFDAETGLLNPYEDDLDAHLFFLGSLIDWRLGSERGELTIRTIDLNRLALANSRRKRLEAIRAVLERWHAADEPIKTSLAEGLRLDARAGEFSECVIAYLRSFGFDV